MVLVDSSVWIELFRRDGDLLTKIAMESLLEEGQATYCGIVKLEVLGGAQGKERVVIANLFSLIPYLSQKELVWEKAVNLQWASKAKGLSVPWSDALIATLAHLNQFRVYARDKHFVALAEAGFITLYEPGPGGAYRAK